MPIEFFGGHQTDVYLPALAVLLVGAVIAVLPVIAAPRLVRARGRGAVIGGCVALAAVAVVVAGALAVPAAARLSDQRMGVRAAIQQRYGLALSSGVVSDLVDGASVPVAGYRKVKLESVGTPGEYILTTGGAKGELPSAG